jgi:hypothetical protein
MGYVLACYIGDALHRYAHGYARYLHGWRDTSSPCIPRKHLKMLVCMHQSRSV